MRGVGRDIGYFFRTVAKSPGFFAVAILTLALGIGANTAIFSVINSVLLRPLPFHEPERLVRLFETEAAPGRYPFAGPDYVDWKAQNRTLEGMSLFEWGRRCNVSGTGQPESAATVDTEANFFSVLGVRPLLGRTFVRGEGASGPSRVAVISHGFWARHFGGTAAIVNRTIELNSEPYTIVGVMPAWFNYPKGTEIWTPLDMSPKELGPRGSHSYLAIGRLKPGVSISQAQADVALIARRLEKEYPDSNEKVGAAVVSMKEQLTHTSREPLLILFGAVALVLLVACANVANLLLIRAGGRRRELAIRAALGAGRWRVVRQLLTESVLLALAGGAAGLAIAWWAVRMFRSAESLPLPLVNPVSIDPAVLAFTFGVAALTGLLFGILPALQASRVPLSEELKAGSQTVLGTGGHSRRLRDVIAVAEIAVSLALLVGAGLLLRSFDAMRRADIGVDSHNVLTMGLSLPPARYDSLATRRAFFDRLLDRLRSSPGILAASMCTQVPLEGGSNGYITVPGRDDAAIKDQLFEWNNVTREYFKALKIPLLQGRNFTPQDEEQAADVAVAVDKVFSSPNPQPDALKGLSWPALISRSMARMVWPKQDAVGRTFLVGGVVSVRVVGVVADVSVRGIRGGVLPQAYFPFVSALTGPSSWRLVVRTAAPPISQISFVRTHVNALDPSLALIEPRTMDDVIAENMLDTSLQTWLLGTFAGLAVVLAAVGLYSVMAFLVAQRRHEIGIRIALGAGHPALLRLILGHAAKLVTVGVVAGLGAALWLSRLMRGLLFGVTPNDMWTFAGVCGLLVLVALVACLVPARRAMRIDPIVALRYE